MANGRVALPEDFLRIGRPAANRRSVLSAILDQFGGEEPVRGVARSAPLTEEARIAALTTRLEIPPDDFGVNLAGVRQPAPYGPAGIPKGVADEQQAAQDFEGFYEWTDDEGVKHATNRPETIPQGARVKYLPFEKPTITGVGGAKLFGEVTPESIAALGKAGETDQQRENRMIKEIMLETGAGRGEAAKAFRESRAEISGVPTAPETFEEKTALRNKIVQNTQRLLKQNPEARNEILKQAGQLMRLRGVSAIKRPEQTIAATIEGQKVEVPLSKWDPKKHGKEGGGQDPSVIKEVKWLINNKVAQDEKEAYRMAKKAMAKETTEREWAIDVRKNLMKGENQYLEEAERQEKYDAEMEWFRNLPGKGTPATIARGVGGGTVRATGERKPLSAFGG